MILLDSWQGGRRNEESFFTTEFAEITELSWCPGSRVVVGAHRLSPDGSTCVLGWALWTLEICR